MYKILLFFILGLVLTSCSKDQTLELKENEIVSGSYVIRERSNGDWIPYTYTSKIASKSVKLSSLSHADYLGYSVRFNEYPIEDTRNIGYRVVNTESFNDDYSTYFTSLKNIGSESSYFAYSVFDDYETKSNITKKVNGGLNIKLLFFSLGVKNEYTKTFSSDIISNSNSAYGELNVIVRDSIFRMQYSSLIKSKIVNGYLDETFLEELHLTHPYEFYNNYGPFVVRDFTTGGRASVIYAGVHNSSSDTEVKSTDMSGEIESSFSFKNGNSYSGSGSLSLGRGNNTSSSYTSKFNSSKLSVKTIGGISSYGSFSVPQDVESTNIDLSGWLSSFSDSSVQSLCEYNENGLIPITDFILEKILLT